VVSRRNARELVKLLKGKASTAEETEEKAAKLSAQVRVGRRLSLAETSPGHVAASKEPAERLARSQMACQCLCIHACVSMLVYPAVVYPAVVYPAVVYPACAWMTPTSPPPPTPGKQGFKIVHACLSSRVGRHRKVRPHRHAKQIEQIDSRDIRIDSKECSRLPAPGNWKWSLLAGQSLGPETALWEVKDQVLGVLSGKPECIDLMRRSRKPMNHIRRQIKEGRAKKPTQKRNEME
jgi:hypothetical protein